MTLLQGEEDWEGEEGSYDEEENELGIYILINIIYTILTNIIPYHIPTLLFIHC
jgi:hypothetical protein